MAVQLDEIRVTAQRVAASHNLDFLDLEFQCGSKFRTLRIFIEKNAAHAPGFAAAWSHYRQPDVRRLLSTNASPNSHPTQTLNGTGNPFSQLCKLFLISAA